MIGSEFTACKWIYCQKLNSDISNCLNPAWPRLSAPHHCFYVVFLKSLRDAITGNSWKDLNWALPSISFLKLGSPGVYLDHSCPPWKKSRPRTDHGRHERTDLPNPHRQTGSGDEFNTNSTTQWVLYPLKGDAFSFNLMILVLLFTCRSYHVTKNTLWSLLWQL